MDNTGRFDALSAVQIKTLIKWSGMKGYSNSDKCTIQDALKDMINEGPPFNSDSVLEVKCVKQFLDSLKMNLEDPPPAPNGWLEWLGEEHRRRENKKSSTSKVISHRKWYRLKNGGREVATVQWVSPAQPICEENLVSAGLNEDELSAARKLSGPDNKFNGIGYTWVELISIDKEFERIFYLIVKAN